MSVFICVCILGVMNVKNYTMIVFKEYISSFKGYKNGLEHRGLKSTL